MTKRERTDRKKGQGGGGGAVKRIREGDGREGECLGV